MRGIPNGKRGSSLIRSLSTPVHIEGWIRHHKVERLKTAMWVFVVAVRLPDVPFELMHGEVHLAEPDGLCGPLNPVDADVTVPVLLVVVDKLSTLDKHTARATRRVQNPSLKRFDNLNDQLNERGRCEELAAPLAFRHCEVAEEILVDFTEGIAFDIHRNLCHDAEQFKEGALFESIIGFGQDTINAAVFCLQSPSLHSVIACPMFSLSGKSNRSWNRAPSGR